MRNLFASTCISIGLLTAPLMAQEVSQEAQMREIAQKVGDLMTELQTRNEEYPQFIQDLSDGLVTIEQADQRVADLISQIKSATDEMEDGKDLDNAIDDYKQKTTELVAEAEASNNNAIKATIPDLQKVLASLEASDGERARTVIDARTLVRQLEQNQEAIAFFIKANQTTRAAELIAANIDEFVRIVENGKQLADQLSSSSINN